MHNEINDSRAKWVDKLTDKSPTIKCRIIHWKSWKSGKADKGDRILATTSLKVQNLPRRRHFLTQSTKVDEQNSLIRWKITSRHDFEEFGNLESEMEEEKHGGGLDPESGLGFRWISGWARFPSSPGAMFGFLVGATIFRWSWSTLAFGWSIHSEEGARERVWWWGRDISHAGGLYNGARGAGIHNTPRGIHVCVHAGERGTLESLRMCGADATN